MSAFTFTFVGHVTLAGEVQSGQPVTLPNLTVLADSEEEARAMLKDKYDIPHNPHPRGVDMIFAVASCAAVEIDVGAPREYRVRYANSRVGIDRDQTRHFSNRAEAVDLYEYVCAVSAGVPPILQSRTITYGPWEGEI